MPNTGDGVNFGGQTVTALEEGDVVAEVLSARRGSVGAVPGPVPGPLPVLLPGPGPVPVLVPVPSVARDMSLNV